MAVTLGSNISSLVAQRRLGESGAALAKTSERLASGQRINRASDDAAGLSIVSTLSSNARVYSQGVRNLNDGISYLSIAEGGISELTSILIRTKELAEQAANGVYSTTQRTALDKESQTLANEYNRILESTGFNGQLVFTAANGSLRIQAGFGINGGILSRITSNNNRTGFVSLITSANSSGVEADASSTRPDISADGRYTVFESDAGNLVAGVLGHQIYRRDQQTGAVVLVSGTAAGEAGETDSTNASISADGRYVVFQSQSHNLVAGVESSQQIYRKDLLTGEIILVSSDAAGDRGSDDSETAVISADGRYVAFRSSASNFDSGASKSIFRKDLQTGALALVSSTSNGSINDGSCNTPFISADGRYVGFTSEAGNFGAPAGTDQIYRKDLQTGALVLASCTGAGVQGDSGSERGSMSADGRYIVFDSLATNLAPNTNGYKQVYRKDLQTGELMVVSATSAGVPSDKESVNASVSGDGRFVVFGSFSTVLGTDTNPSNRYLLYIKDLATGRINRLDIDDATEDRRPTAKISADGRYIASESGNNSATAPGSNGSYNTFIATNSLVDQGSTSRLTWFNLKTQDEARAALPWLDTYLNEVNYLQGQIGASRSRFGSALSTLSATILNSKAAEGRIRDVDIASESAEYTKNQIIQQVAASVLSQANQGPTLALQLLR